MSRILDILPVSLKEDHHPTAYKWCFWQHFRFSGVPSQLAKENEEKEVANEKEDKSEDNGIYDLRDTQYLQETTLLSFPKVYSKINEQTTVIDSIEQFWNSLSNLKSIEEVSVDTEYFFFKEGIQPLWEDESNKKGGKWSFSFANTQLGSRKLGICLFWELLLLKLVSGKFIDDDISLPLSKEVLDNQEFEDIECHKSMSNKELNKLIMDDIAGLVISVRNKRIIVSIWNTQLSFEKYKLENGVQEIVWNEDYNSLCREVLSMKNKFVYEELGLTTFLFRKLIYDSFVKTMNEAFETVCNNSSKEESRNLNYRSQILKYTPHFNERTMDSKKHKPGFKKEWSNSKFGKVNENSNGGGNNDKMSNLGKIRKKIEFDEEGLVVEEVNILSSMRSKWNKRRTTGREE